MSEQQLESASSAVAFWAALSRAFPFLASLAANRIHRQADRVERFVVEQVAQARAFALWAKVPFALQDNWINAEMRRGVSLVHAHQRLKCLIEAVRYQSGSR